MIDIFDDELTQMDENEARVEQEVSAAIQLKDPIRTLAKKCIVLSEDVSLDEALKTFKKHSTSCVILTKDKKITGIFTERDIVLGVLGKRLDFSQSSVKDFRTPNPHTLRMEDPISFALNMMVDGGFRHIPIVDKKKLSERNNQYFKYCGTPGNCLSRGNYEFASKTIKKTEQTRGGINSFQENQMNEMIFIEI